ncbi:sulfatase [Dysgonomonas sp. 25]|uniref:sulfatase family protein n=1 Tax=Dysgonomonas sp. 25 TaxID=2302933 RepID=UPI0013CFFBFC|nr:sulfatase [Dysgonomonas sp. 25]NDV68835.1 DUF4976 domain-containing protein [Dysgonomonas sp. 25]
MKLRKGFLLPVGLICGFTPLIAQSAPQPSTGGKERPNILFILSDDHTSQAWGIYGGVLGDYVRNDNIRRLAEEGCTLDNTFCTNSISVPSRAAILTGAYSQNNGVYTLEDALYPEADNIAKQLQMSGYQTALFGKWHLKKKPAGFDDFCVFHDQGEYYNPIMKTERNWVDDDIAKAGDTISGFSTDIVTGMTIDWIKNRDKDKPFMMFCHFKATHEPWDFPERFRYLYDDVVFPEPESMMEFGPEQSGRTYEGRQLENMAWRWENTSKDPAAWWCLYPELPFSIQGLDKTEARKKTYQKLVKDYLRCGAAIDDNIGRLLDTLDKEGLAENTIVVYVSDQGYFLGEHGFFDKRMMLEESLRMPFVIRYPKEIPAGTRNDDIILNVDFAALLADYAGANVPEKSQGRSFRENLKGDTPADWRQSMYYRYWTHHTIRPAHMGIRSRDYKLMFLYGDPLGMDGSDMEAKLPEWEFYDLKTDPYENHNQYNNPEYKDIIYRMKREMLNLRYEVQDTDKDNPRMEEILQSYYW